VSRVREDNPLTSERWITRQGREVAPDAVFDAWTSGDLGTMLGVAEHKTNLIDRHFLLLNIVGLTYKGRADSEMRSLCRKFSEMHLAEFDRIAPALKEDMGGVLPRVPTFQHFATVLAEDGENERAIEVCRRAISYGLSDGTQSGYDGRIARIQKRIERGIGMGL
jgi:hypothetical protein